jgi:hypothetical protein
MGSFDYLPSDKSFEKNPSIHTINNIDRLLIINSFDANAKKSRKNKKELFNDLSIRIRTILSEEINRRGFREAVIIEELIENSTGQDSIYFQLMKSKQASGAIVIKDINVWFEQTGVDVVKEGKSKSRTAYYDICSEVSYVLYNQSTFEKENAINRCEYFTERSVMSGLLAAGPDIVGKSKHAFNMVEKNAKEYARGLNFE